MKVFIIDKETGKSRELPVAVCTIHLSEPEPQKQEDGRYSFNVSVKAKASFMSRREEKAFVKWARSLPKPRLATKAEIAAEIARLLQSQGKILVPTFARKSRKEFVKMYLQLKNRT